MSIFIGALSFFLIVINTLFWCSLLLTIAIFKLLIPVEAWKRICTKWIIVIGECWIFCNGLWIRVLHKPKWSIQGFDSLDKSNWYLIIANHQSMADIFILQGITNRKIPMLKFFMKDVGKDISKMKKAFERFARYPVSIFSFAEGTRFTKTKHASQDSPYDLLLKPKSGGIGLALSTMPYIKKVLDFTIKYESQYRTFWDFLCGRMSNVEVQVKIIDVPENLVAKNYTEDGEFREELKEWLYAIWEEKNKFLNNKF